MTYAVSVSENRAHLRVKKLTEEFCFGTQAAHEEVPTKRWRNTYLKRLPHCLGGSGDGLRGISFLTWGGAKFCLALLRNTCPRSPTFLPSALYRTLLCFLGRMNDRWHGKRIQEGGRGSGQDASAMTTRIWRALRMD